MKLTQPITGSGVVTDRDGKVWTVPCCNWGPINYPLPSECDIWIKLFKDLRDHFTDEEIINLNKQNWLDVQSVASGASIQEIIDMMEAK